MMPTCGWSTWTSAPPCWRTTSFIAIHSAHTRASRFAAARCGLWWAAEPSSATGTPRWKRLGACLRLREAPSRSADLARDLVLVDGEKATVAAYHFAVDP